MSLIKDIKDKKTPIAVVGLGYVGMPLAVEFAKSAAVIGFDINSQKIESYKSGNDITGEVGNDALVETSVFFTSDPSELSRAKVFIISVPTPVSSDKVPDLTPVISASQTVGQYMPKGSIVVYESTVYPGTTEEICVAELEGASGLKFGVDFKVGYSPERINPSDKVNTLRTIKKIVSASDSETLEFLAELYSLAVDAGVHKVSGIKVAEAAKVVENSQRDINIAFMNELSMVFDRMGINTKEVVDAMNTKWNALAFTPGLVGGHCIGVDPYYFIYRAEQLGYHSQIILSGRKINDDMPAFVVNAIVKKLIEADKKVKNANVAILGITFKENCPDVRNSKVVDIVTGLNDYGINTIICDPVCNSQELSDEYGLILSDIRDLTDIDAVVLAVPHKAFKDMPLDNILGLMNVDGKKVLIDVKSIFSPDETAQKGALYWSL